MSQLRKLLFPISIIYFIFQLIKNKLYDLRFLKVTEFDIPTLCIGNLSMGGSGKTPLVNYIIKSFKNQYKIAFLSRGYNRNTSGYILANDKNSAQEIGDEPYLIKKNHKKLIVSVSENRVYGIQKIIKSFKGIQMFVLDDAFQHRRLKCSLNIVLSKFDSPFYNDCLIPVGNLREPKSGIKRANIIIITKCPLELKHEKKINIIKKINPSINQKVFFSSILYDNFLVGINKIHIDKLIGSSVILITGIADSSSLEKYLLEKEIFFDHIKFNDHHKYDNSDIDNIKLRSNNKLIITTEKDYYKIIAIEKLSNIYFQGINIKFHKGSEDFNLEIKKYIK